MTFPNELKGIVASDPDYLGGQLRFVGTRVLVESLFDYVKHNDLEGFFVDFRNVSRAQAGAVLAWQDRLARSALGIEVSA